MQKYALILMFSTPELHLWKFLVWRNNFTLYQMDNPVQDYRMYHHASVTNQSVLVVSHAQEELVGTHLKAVSTVICVVSGMSSTCEMVFL